MPSAFSGPHAKHRRSSSKAGVTRSARASAPSVRDILITDRETVAQLHRQPRILHALAHTHHIVRHAADFDQPRRLIVRGERRLRVSVARLADAPRVDDVAIPGYDIDAAASRQPLMIRAARTVLIIDLRDMCVADKR